MTHRAETEVVAITYSLDRAEKRELERLVRQGRIAKWRGRWFPIAGAPFGIGPLKTCYGPAVIRDALQALCHDPR